MRASKRIILIPSVAQSRFVDEVATLFLKTGLFVIIMGGVLAFLSMVGCI